MGSGGPQKIVNYTQCDRLSLNGQLCTVRYHGPVQGKPGIWLGVEWDDGTRGKHNGTHEGQHYFQCRSTFPTCASFLRSAQKWDTPRTFLQALHVKYMPDFHPEQSGRIYFSGKEAEEIGFEKFHQRQAQLRGIQVLVLDHMQISSPASNQHEIAAISETCPAITDVDLSSNLFTALDEVAIICSRIPKLRRLTLNGNRFQRLPTTTPLETIKTLDLASTLIEPSDLESVLCGVFPSIEELGFGQNELSRPLSLSLPSTVTSIDLSGNLFNSISDLSQLWRSSQNLKVLNLKHNRIASMTALATDSIQCPVKELDLSYNAISTFAFFDSITPAQFPNLTHLRVTGNPLYQALVSAGGKPLAPADGYMLTLARLPLLEHLNYTRITEKERLNAETYYLSQIAIELGSSLDGEAKAVIARHPRYKALCEEYGEPNVTTRDPKDSVDPDSLAARLISINFKLSPTTLSHVQLRAWTEEIPRSLSIYAVQGMVGKRLTQMPDDLHLILETDEQDPLGNTAPYSGPEWWDSDEEEDPTGVEHWIRRELDVSAGTRALGTYVVGREANVRIEIARKDV